MTAALPPVNALALPEGLSEGEALQRLSTDGRNELPVSRPRSMLRLVREVTFEPMFLLLVACGALYVALGDVQEALMLLGFVFVLMGIGFVQQRRSERSLDALRDLSSPQARVRRAGNERSVSARDLVVGDVVMLAEGDRVPADLSLMSCANLAIDESLLTGESAPVSKQAVVLAASAGDVTSPVTDAGLAHAFSGTLATRGTAWGQVTATSGRSALGRIGKSLSGIQIETTPIQKETCRVVTRIAIIGRALAAALAITFWLLRGDWLHGLLAGITLAMAVLTEELPVVLTLFLGLGAWRLAREKVLARSIPAVELLGATTVLCVDMNGTLTANRMTVMRLWSEAAVHDSTKAGAAPLQEELHGVLEFAVLASHRRAFDPMESAIGESGQRLLAHTEHLHTDWTLIDDYPFSPEMLAMSRVWQSPDRREFLIAAKGAPEAIVNLCHLDVLGVAQATFAAGVLRGLQHDFDFRFLGLVGLAGAQLMASSDADRDEMARALTFFSLVLANLALIHTNRSWNRTVWWGRAVASGQFGWIALGTLAVLSLVLIVPGARRQFSFVTPTPFLLFAALGRVAVSLLWFEAVKWGVRVRSRHAG